MHWQYYKMNLRYMQQIFTVEFSVLFIVNCACVFTTATSAAHNQVSFQLRLIMLNMPSPFSPLSLTEAKMEAPLLQHQWYTDQLSPTLSEYILEAHSYFGSAVCTKESEKLGNACQMKGLLFTRYSCCIYSWGGWYEVCLDCVHHQKML